MATYTVRIKHMCILEVGMCALTCTLHHVQIINFLMEISGVKKSQLNC